MKCSVVRNQQHTHTDCILIRESTDTAGCVVAYIPNHHTNTRWHTHTYSLSLLFSSIPLHTDSLPTSTLSFSPFLSLQPSFLPSDSHILFTASIAVLHSLHRFILYFFFIPVVPLSINGNTLFPSISSIHSTLSLPLDRYNFSSESRYTASSIALKTSSGRSLSGRVN